MKNQTKRARLIPVILFFFLMSCQQALAKTQLQTVTFIPDQTEALTPAEAMGAANPLLYEVVAVRNFSTSKSDYDPAYDPVAKNVPLSWPSGAAIVYNSYSIKSNTAVPSNGFLSGYLSTSNSTSGNTVRFEQLLANTAYTMFVYSQSAVNGEIVSLKVNGESVGSLTTVDNSRTTFAEGINYLKLEVFTDGYGMVSLNYSNTSGHGVINAVQLGEAVPEPKTLVLLGIGCLAMPLVQRIRNRGITLTIF